MHAKPALEDASGYLELHSGVRYIHATPHYTTLHCTALPYTTPQLHSATLHCTALHPTALRLHCTALPAPRCTKLHHAASCPLASTYSFAGVASGHPLHPRGGTLDRKTALHTLAPRATTIARGGGDFLNSLPAAMVVW